MAKSYIKTGTSLVQVSEDKIRNYADLDAVKAAIVAGCLHEGDLFTTICTNEDVCDDLQSEILRILSYIPTTTSATNQLLNHCDMGTALDDIECAKCDIADLQTCVTNLNSCKVECSDYQTCCTAWDTSITNLCSCPGLSCTGTLVPSDLDTINTCIACLKSCPGLDCTGNVSGSRVCCSDYETCCSNWNTCISCLKACSGLDCTGNVTKAQVNAMFTLSGTTLTITSVS